MTKKTFDIGGMHCASCALMIESDLEDAGVRARVNYAKQTLAVEFDEKKIPEGTIRQIVSHLGYTVKKHP